MLQFEVYVSPNESSAEVRRTVASCIPEVIVVPFHGRNVLGKLLGGRPQHGKA